MKHCIMLATLAEYIGDGAAAKLVQHYGGHSVKIPKRQRGSTWAELCKAIGPDSAATLCEHFGGEPVYIAKDHRAALTARRAEVQRMRAQGKSFAEIARSMPITTTYTERGIRRLAGAGETHQTHTKQQSLFEIPVAHPLMSLFKPLS